MDLKGGQDGVGDPRGRWNWQVAGFEPRTALDQYHQEEEDERTPRYSTSTMPPPPQLLRHNLFVKVHQLKEQLLAAREDMLEIRQEASDLQEYSSAKLGRVTRYLGVLAEKARKLDRIALETEARIAPLIAEKKKLFNDLLTVKGTIRVFCRVRPQFEDEGLPVTEFPDDFTIRINPGGDPVTSSKKDFEFDRVYGPHVGQGDFFQDIQPFVQSALDGYNVSVFAYGQTGAGKTHTMEGSSHDRGVYFRAFEELYDLSNADTTSSSKFYFHVTVFELHNEQVHDLLLSSSGNISRIHMGMVGSSIELVQEKVENPTEFSKVLKLVLQNRGMNNLKTAQHKHSHLVVTIHIHCSSSLTGQSHYSKLSLVDLAGSERLPEEASGEHLTELLHVNKSLSALGDVVSALTGKKDHVPYGNSRLTQILSDSLGGDSKTLIITNVSPSCADIRETISSLNFAARARNVELSLGNRDTIKKWRDMANDARKEMYEKEMQVSDAREEIIRLKKQLKEADSQSLLLFSEVQKAWKVAFALQADLKTESVMLQEQQKIEKEQNAQLRNQVARLMKVEQEQKIHLVECTNVIQTLEAKIKEFESKLSEVHAIKGMNKGDTDSGQGSINISSSQSLNTREKDTTTLSITNKLEEELAKRDKLIERLHEENEKLFERLTERSGSGGSPKVASRVSRGFDNLQLDGSVRNGNFYSKSPDQGSLSTGGTLSLVKSGSQKMKTTPAGEYLTAALMDFNPDQYESLATVADGANKLLMLVLAAVIKAGAAREHEMLAEIRDAVFAFISKMEPRRVMDTMLVSRVRILYIRSLLSRSPELQTIKVPPVERFLEKASMGRSRNSSRGSSPGRSPGRYYHNSSSDFNDDHVRTFKVNIKQEKKSKFSSIVLKLRGIDQETWQQHVTGGKLREVTEEGRNFATGNKSLAALFVHTPAGELQRQIRSWLAENFDFLSVTGGDGVGGVAGQLELLSTAIMDGWMAGLGTPQHPSTDSLGQLLSDYTKRVYTSQLQHLKINIRNT
ncbi:kinesin-like protein KIN-14L isoform X2 [Cryptomeria japonica]|uniref:kinesin-like protein KIN-14L isoform X2 n=1 Tax=Cryptomeria japonica TaxID=3369 RepID=UPI0025ABD0F6|nr:kinesin-like protein KIN-14L isoform X2 [Cryptomeria japonica]